jgi:hypothetical protein
MLAKYVDLQVYVLVFAFHLLVCSRYLYVDFFLDLFNEVVSSTDYTAGVE